MSQADNLLDTLVGEEAGLYSANPSTEPHIVIGTDRFIIVPDSLKRIGVQYDHNVETVTFDCPRYWDNIDMSRFTAFIMYIRPDGTPGSYVAEKITPDGDIMHFDWVISRHVTEFKGTLSLLVCLKEIGEDGLELNHWNSEISNAVYISEGLECNIAITDGYPDVIAMILYRLAGIEAKVDGDSGPSLPEVSTDDNGKFLRVVNGAWAAVELTDASLEGG
jgi:hypothetical protein